MSTYTLGTGSDVVVGTSGDDTVNGTASTLNASDQLDGGDGHDTLALFGSGSFDLSTLAQFTNFEEVDLTNLSGGQSSLVLGGGDLTVNVDNETFGGGTIQLGSGTTTVNLGANGYSYNVSASTGATTINASSGNNNVQLSTGDATVTFSGGTYNNGYYMPTFKGARRRLTPALR